MFDAAKIKDELILWIRDYFEKNGHGYNGNKDCCAVIAISGGKDSSIVAALCVNALGKDRVFGVLMPQGNQHDIGFSRDLVAYLGIQNVEINIKNCVDSLTGSITQSGLTMNRVAQINTPARIRMTTAYAVSAILNGRVANTCNLSEDWVGYATKFGDGAGDFSPLSQLTVTEVKLIGRELALPAKFIDKMPEDGLTGLSDEENLGFSYDILDRYIREGVCENPETKALIDRLHQNNLHKLNLIPCFTPSCNQKDS